MGEHSGNRCYGRACTDLVFVLGRCVSRESAMREWRGGLSSLRNGLYAAVIAGSHVALVQSFKTSCAGSSRAKHLRLFDCTANSK